jgi:hypothetical protein
MSDDPGLQRDPQPLDYRSASDERGSIAARAIGAGVIAFVMLWAGAFGGGFVGGRRGVIAGGLLATAIVVITAQILRRKERNAYVAGAWVGLALGLLLVGWCAAMM